MTKDQLKSEASKFAGWRAGRQMMIEDGAPPSCFMSIEERAGEWKRNPPKAMPTFNAPLRVEDEATARFRAEQEAERKAATAKRIARLLESKKKKEQPRNYKGLRWDQRNCKWVPETQEVIMPKWTILPYDAAGAIVERGKTSIDDQATQDQIDAKVLAAVERGGKKIAKVLLTGVQGQTILAWKVEAGEVSPVEQTTLYKDIPADADAAPAEATSPDTGAAEQETEESNMAKKAKAKSKGVKKVKAPRKAKANGEVRKGSKTEIVAKLLKRDTGCTSAQVLEATGWPAVSMPAMAKACGLKLRKDKVKGEVTRYFGS